MKDNHAYYDSTAALSIDRPGRSLS